METRNEITTYKGFDKDLKCREFQYEIGKEYECGYICMCTHGFHACENPMDTIDYYKMHNSRFCKVKQYGDIQKGHVADTKICSSKIKIEEEIDVKILITEGIRWMKDHLKYDNKAESQKPCAYNVDCDSECIKKSYSNIGLEGNGGNMAIFGDYNLIRANTYRCNVNLSGNNLEMNIGGESTRLNMSGEKNKISIKGGIDANISGVSSEIYFDGGFRELNVDGNNHRIAAVGRKNKINISGELTNVFMDGELSEIISTCDMAKIGLTGDDNTIYSSGTYSEITSCGDNTVINSCGNHARIKSTGDYARIIINSSETRVESEGKNALIICISCIPTIKAKKGSVIVVKSYSKNAKTFKSIVVGEEKMKEDKWYTISEGKLLRVD